MQKTTPSHVGAVEHLDSRRRDVTGAYEPRKVKRVPLLKESPHLGKAVGDPGHGGDGLMLAL